MNKLETVPFFWGGGGGGVLVFTCSLISCPRLCSNGTLLPEATNIWPWATENIFLVAQPGDLLMLVSRFTVKNTKKEMLFNRAGVDIQRSFHVNSRIT